jgi:uncharacterized repeat protein (TIGR02543 family)
MDPRAVECRRRDRTNVNRENDTNPLTKYAPPRSEQVAAAQRAVTVFEKEPDMSATPQIASFAVLVRRLVFLSLLASVCLAASTQEAQATHLAYGTLSWERLPPAFAGELGIRVRLSYEFGYRPSFFPTAYGVGDSLPPGTRPVTVTGSGAFYAVFNLPLVVKSVSTSEDLLVAAGSIDVLVPSSEFPVFVDASAADRLSALREGNHDTAQNLRITIDPSKADRSPIAVAVPRIYLPAGFQFNPPLTISSRAFEAMTNRVEFAAAADSGLVTTVPNGTLACPSTGCAPDTPGSMQLSPNGSIAWVPQIGGTFPQLYGLYAVQFTIASVDANNLRTAAVPLDTTVAVVSPCPTCPFPAFSPATPATITVKAGEGVSVPISVSSGGPAPTVTLSTLTLPGTAIFTPSADPPGPTAAGSLSWTPTTADTGRSVACFRAINSAGYVNFGLYCVTIDVWRDFVVTFDSKGGTPVASQMVVPGGTATLPASPTRTDQLGSHYFVGWTLDPQASVFSTPFAFSQPIPRDVTLYAMWTQSLRTVSFNSNGGSAVSAQTVPLGTGATEPAPPARDGYAFAGWYSDPGLTSAFDFTNSALNRIFTNTTLYAKWTINTYIVSFDSKGGTSVPSQTVAFNTAATQPPAPTKAGYSFAGWYSDAGLVNAFSFATPITANVTLFAKWTLPYTFTGFLTPVDNLPILNVGQAGRTFPIKWRLANAGGTPVTALTSFASFSDTSIACEASPSDVLEEQLTVTTSGIRYDAAENLFVYNWKTGKGAVGCRLITITLDDGSQHYAKFQLR